MQISATIETNERERWDGWKDSKGNKSKPMFAVVVVGWLANQFYSDTLLHFLLHNNNVILTFFTQCGQKVCKLYLESIYVYIWIFARLLFQSQVKVEYDEVHWTINKKEITTQTIFYIKCVCNGIICSTWFFAHFSTNYKSIFTYHKSFC